MKIREPDIVSVATNTTIERTMAVINESGLGVIALVVNENRELLGTVTDADIRRGLRWDRFGR